MSSQPSLPTLPSSSLSPAPRYSSLRSDGGALSFLTFTPSNSSTSLSYLNPSGFNAERVSQDFDVRCKVHEYGGACYFAVGAGRYVFSAVDAGGGEKCCLVEKGAVKDLCEGRFGCYVGGDDGFVYAVRERKVGSNETAAVLNEIVVLDLANGGAEVVVEGDDFYDSLEYDKESKWLYYKHWNHPSMPWDEANLSRMNLSSQSRDVEVLEEGVGVYDICLVDNVLTYLCEVGEEYKVVKLGDDGKREILAGQGAGWDVSTGSMGWRIGERNLARGYGGVWCEWKEGEQGGEGEKLKIGAGGDGGGGDGDGDGDDPFA